jgi:hypothetical protein
MQAALPSSEVPALIQGLSSGNMTGVPDLSPSITTAAKAAYKEAYSQSFKVVYLSSIAFGACAIVAAFYAPNLEERFTRIVARRLIDKRERNQVTNTDSTTTDGLKR